MLGPIACVVFSSFAYVGLPTPTLEFQAAGRDVDVYLPASPAAGALPVVVGLHGGNSNLVDFETRAGILGEIDATDFVYVLVNGQPSGEPDQYLWNASDECCGAVTPTEDDVEFLTEVVHETKRQVASWGAAMANPDVVVDDRQVYVFGHSNGAFMAHEFASERANLVAGVASLAGMAADDLLSQTPVDEVHVLHMHSNEDPSLDLCETSLGYLGDILDAYETVELWTEFNTGTAPTRIACTNDLPTLTLDLVEDVTPTDDTGVIVYEDGAGGGAATEMWIFDDDTHFPVFKPAFATALVDWLTTRAKPGVWFDVGAALGSPRLVGSGPLTPGSMLTLDLTDAPPDTTVTLVVGFSPLFAPFKGGRLVCPTDLTFTLTTGMDGTARLTTTLPSSGVGVFVYYQAWMADASGPQGFIASNGLLGVLQ